MLCSEEGYTSLPDGQPTQFARDVHVAALAVTEPSMNSEQCSAVERTKQYLETIEPQLSVCANKTVNLQMIHRDDSDHDYNGNVQENRRIESKDEVDGKEDEEDGWKDKFRFLKKNDTQKLAKSGVREAEELIDEKNHPTPIYRMKSNPKGHALIIVNQTFKLSGPKHYPDRPGAEKDFDMLQSLFAGLGYQVHAHFDQTSNEMLSIIEEFTTVLDHSAVDSSIVAISTHGEPDCIIGCDSKELCRDEILKKFSNKSCPTLADKPKLFFFQACRGGKRDTGVDFEDCSSAMQKDMWIFSSTIPEFVSWRRPDGSWFIVAITEVFSKHAWNTPLSELYNKVDERLAFFEARTEDRNKQVAELTKMRFSKDLYFNPGKYETQ